MCISRLVDREHEIGWAFVLHFLRWGGGKGVGVAIRVVGGDGKGVGGGGKGVGGWR